MFVRDKDKITLGGFIDELLPKTINTKTITLDTYPDISIPFFLILPDNIVEIIRQYMNENVDIKLNMYVHEITYCNNSSIHPSIHIHVDVHHKNFKCTYCMSYHNNQYTIRLLPKYIDINILMMYHCFLDNPFDNKLFGGSDVTNHEYIYCDTDSGCEYTIDLLALFSCYEKQSDIILNNVIDINFHYIPGSNLLTKSQSYITSITYEQCKRIYDDTRNIVFYRQQIALRHVSKYSKITHTSVYDSEYKYDGDNTDPDKDLNMTLIDLKIGNKHNFITMYNTCQAISNIICPIVLNFFSRNDLRESFIKRCILPQRPITNITKNEHANSNKRKRKYDNFIYK